MKRVSSLLSLSLVLGLSSAALGGCLTETDEEGTAGSEVNAGELDDAVATTILEGGCTVSSAGKTLKTVGSGGKCPTTLSDILDLMDENQDPSVFVVDEEGDHLDAGDHRFVIASKKQKSKLFLATVARRGEVSEDGVEAIGFSPKLQAFVYYKVSRGQWRREGDGTMVKANASGGSAPFECANCHTTGAPLMKELHDSWGNWHSTWFIMPPPKDPNALFLRLFDKKEKADLLEPMIIKGVKLHSKGRVERARKEKRLSGILEQLMCEVGEPTLIGSHLRNTSRVGDVGSSSRMLPTSILLNPLFTPPRTGTGNELGLEESLQTKIPSLGDIDQSIDPDAYVKAIASNRQKVGGERGDAMFPMFGPEKSFADIDAIQELLREKLIDKDVVADILMTDFTTSVFSVIRCELASTLPDTWKDATDLRSQWKKKLSGSSLKGAKGLLARLENEKDFGQHEATLETFAKACSDRSRSDAAAFTGDVLRLLSQRRVEFVDRYSHVVESPSLIPEDRLGSRPNKIRFNGATCTIEPTSAPIVGAE